MENNIDKYLFVLLINFMDMTGDRNSNIHRL